VGTSIISGKTGGWLVQLLRYTLVSSASFALDMAILAALVEWMGVHYLVASTVGYLVALLVDYGASIVWVFAHRRLNGRGLTEFVSFAAIGIAGLGVNTLVIYVCTEALALHYALSKVVAGLFVLLFTFVVRRQLLFTTSPAQLRDREDGSCPRAVSRS
jgi:putative flippase GtrA